MSARRWPRAASIALLLWSVAATAQDAGTPDAGAQVERPLSNEDAEVINDLDLLENLDAAAELDLLLELAEE